MPLLYSVPVPAPCTNRAAQYPAAGTLPCLASRTSEEAVLQSSRRTREGSSRRYRGSRANRSGTGGDDREITGDGAGGSGGSDRRFAGSFGRWRVRGCVGVGRRLGGSAEWGVWGVGGVYTSDRCDDTLCPVPGRLLTPQRLQRSVRRYAWCRLRVCQGSVGPVRLRHCVYG